jgi:hypothetical protein
MITVKTFAATDDVSKLPSYTLMSLRDEIVERIRNCNKRQQDYKEILFGLKERADNEINNRMGM